MNFKDKEAIYLQIADYVSEHITMGKWQPGEKIPSVRDLAILLQVNPNTVMRTYEHLQQQEILFNKRGLGLFVADDAVTLIKTARKERFVQQELPGFFNSLYMLDVEPEEIMKLYNDFKGTKKPRHENEQ